MTCFAKLMCFLVFVNLGLHIILQPACIANAFFHNSSEEICVCLMLLSVGKWTVLQRHTYTSKHGCVSCSRQACSPLSVKLSKTALSLNTVLTHLPILTQHTAVGFKCFVLEWKVTPKNKSFHLGSLPHCLQADVPEMP